MAIDVQQNSAHTFTLYPLELPSAVSVTAYTSSRTVLAGPTSCTNTWATKAVVSATANTITVGSAFTAGLVSVGDTVTIARTDRTGLWCLGVVTGIDAPQTTFTFQENFAFDLRAADTISVTRCTFALAAGNTGTRQTGCYLEWSVTHSAGVRKYETAFHVVRKPFVSPATPDLVQKILSDNFPNDSRFTDAEVARIAEKATEAIRAQVAQGGRYIHLVSEDYHFEDAADLAIRLELAKRDLRPAGVDFLEWKREATKDFKEAVAAGIRQGRYDENDDGIEDVGEKPGPRSIRIVW